MIYVLYTFDSSSAAMQSEIILEDKKIPARLVPLLPEIDAGCGMALRFDLKYKKEVEEIFSKINFDYKEKYLLEYTVDDRKPKVKNYDLF